MMSQPSAAPHYEFDDSYQRFKLLQFDYRTSRWLFAQWMPPGWQPPSSPPSAPGLQYRPGPTTPHQSYSAVDSAYGSSPISPLQFGSGAIYGSGSSGPAGAAHAQPYGTLVSQLYGPATTAQSTYSSPWPSNQHSSQQQYSYAGPSNPQQTQPVRPMPRGTGTKVTKPQGSKHPNEEVYETYYVRRSKFFFEGRVFSIIMNETAGANSTANMNDYYSNPSLNAVKYKNNIVFTQVRRFVVVRTKREFCYACPIFTYSGKATTKKGVRPAEHGVAYSWGTEPRLVPGEVGIKKASIAIVMAKDVPELEPASRIYYGIQHPIQYNLKVKEIGYVPQTHVPTLIGNWRAEDENDTNQSSATTANAEIPDDVPEGSDEDTEEGTQEEDDSDDEDEEDEREVEEQDDPTISQLTNTFSRTNMQSQQ